MAQYAGGGSGSTRPTNKQGPAVKAPTTKTGGYKPTVGPRGITAVPAGNASSRGYSPQRGGVASGGYSGGYAASGGGLGSSRGGQISSSVSPPRPPTLSDFLASDSTYNQQISALDKAKADYAAQQGLAKTNYLTGFTGDLSKLKQSRTDALSDLENDFASRGLIRSGLYADNLADVNKDFDTKQSDLNTAKAQFLAQLASDLSNFTSEQTISRTKAKSDATARRSSGFTI